MVGSLFVSVPPPGEVQYRFAVRSESLWRSEPFGSRTFPPLKGVTTAMGWFSSIFVQTSGWSAFKEPWCGTLKILKDAEECPFTIAIQPSPSLLPRSRSAPRSARLSPASSEITREAWLGVGFMILRCGSPWFGNMPAICFIARRTVGSEGLRVLNETGNGLPLFGGLKMIRSVMPNIGPSGWCLDWRC
jgi:hypothetical protein